MKNVGSESEVRQVVTLVLQALLELGAQEQYSREWGDPTSALATSSVEDTVDHVFARRHNELRLNGVQLRLYWTVSGNADEVTFVCWVCGAGDEGHYGNFVADANQLLQRLGVLEPGRERQLSLETCV